jgi:hypothetical protein
VVVVNCTLVSIDRACNCCRIQRTLEWIPVTERWPLRIPIHRIQGQKRWANR